MKDAICQAIMGRGFKLATKPDHSEVCAICGETPVQPVEVRLIEYNLIKRCCKKCLNA